MPIRTGPPEPALREALERVGFDRVTFDANRIALPRRGMGLTLNGIAQGYVTDRVVGILRAGGIDEQPRRHGRAAGRGLPSLGRAMARRHRRSGSIRTALARHWTCVDQAVATSGAYGFRFDAAGRFNHLLDPRTGASARLYRSVTTVMPSATAADALSTAFSLMPVAAITRTLRQLGKGQVRLTTETGEAIALTS